MERKRVAVLGSTGSIGTQALEVIRAQGSLCAVALAAARNVDLMEKQIREFRPRLACMWEDRAAADLKARVADLPVRVLQGMDGLLAISTMPDCDLVLSAVVGMIGIRPTIAAIESGKDVALANKETLVAAGHLIMPLAKGRGVRILPVDSEHSAIFQCLQGQAGNSIRRILLTASGGPFRGMTRRELKRVRLEDALRHPNWSMGKKVTIDSASMVNKGLEVMEAGWLFDVAPDQIQVVVHPESVVHSAVEYEDGAVIAQLGAADMRLPIQYALLYPRRAAGPAKRLDLFSCGGLTFLPPDFQAFPGLALAYRAAACGHSMPTVFNAANEVAVRLLLEGKIRFCQIPEIIQGAMERHHIVENPGLEEILAAQAETEEGIMRERKL